MLCAIGEAGLLGAGDRGITGRHLEPAVCSEMHPNAVLGTLEALAVRWRIQPWFAGTPELGEELTACLLHKAYQLATLERRHLPRRFVEGDI